MIRRHVSKILGLCIICTLTLTSTATAYADWAPGILTATNLTATSSISNEINAKEVDAKEAYCTQVFMLINGERSTAGLDDIKELYDLTYVSDIRAKEASLSFSHIRPSGLSCSTAFTNNDLIYSYAGENLAYGFKSPSDLVKSWMASKGHRKNILSSNFVYGGIGYFQNSKGVIYCSLLLYTPKAL